MTVWDFARTTEAWFVGDYLMCADFQNHCLGLLYFMNLRFDHLVHEGNLRQADIDDATWHWGTIAFAKIDDVLETWEKSEANSDMFPVRAFYRDWLMRYWDSYQLSDKDQEALDGIQALVRECPELTARVMRSLMGGKELRRKEALKPLLQYWVDPNANEEAYKKREEYWAVVEGPQSRELPHKRQSVELDAPFENKELV